MTLTDMVSVALETNGRGYLGFIVELPGAFVRGKTKQEALLKVPKEVSQYLKWLGSLEKSGCKVQTLQAREYGVEVVQAHVTSLAVEDADGEILLDADKGTLEEEGFRNLLDLVWFSGEAFVRLCTKAKFKDWVDEARIRRTFYGDNPTTIQQIFDHVKNCQLYYLSRMRIGGKTEADFMTTRRFCLGRLEALYRENNNSLELEVDNERWTLKKTLRRFVWHDRIHAKAIGRILEKQRQLGIIDKYDDPFCFAEVA